MKNRKWQNVVIVLTCIAIFVVPVFTNALRQERANWHLAAAANALELGEGDFVGSIKEAEGVLPEVKESHNYWLVRIDHIAKESPKQLPITLRQAIAAGADRSILYGRAMQHWSAIIRGKIRSIYSERAKGTYIAPLQGAYASEFDLQLRIVETALTPEDMDSPVIRNQIAYVRACAGEDLDKALEDINYALERFPANYGYLDTRAWVQFRRGEFELALKDANTAIEKLHKELKRVQNDPVSQFFQVLLEWLGGDEDLRADASDQASGDQDEGTLQVENADPNIWLEGVLRYHRMRALLALSRDSEAEEDRQWLVEQHLPLDEALH